MRPFSFLIVAGLSLWLSGCATSTPPPPEYTNFFDHQPRSILVVPPANKTTAVDTPAVFLTTVSAAFAERGYYVFPVFLVQDILNDLGATDEGAIAAIPPEQFKEGFGTDLILYVTITDWTTSYIVLASNIIMGAEYRLVDASTPGMDCGLENRGLFTIVVAAHRISPRGYHQCGNYRHDRAVSPHRLPGE